MGTLYDPDLQDAPVYPVLFEIMQNNKVVQIVNPKKDFVIRCSVYVPSVLKQLIAKYDHFVYATLLADGKPISQQVGTMNANYDLNDSIAQFMVKFECDNLDNLNQINLQMAITAKHSGEMGIGESLRVGRFINTCLPLENSHE